MGTMKNYKQLIKELPARSVVFAFGRFNPPTTGHELLVQAVKVLAAKRKADHVIYASRSQDSKKNPLTVDKKVQYLRLMFPKTNFLAANDHVRTFLEAAKQLNSQYKNIIMVAGSDRVPEFKRLLQTYNGKEFHFDTIEVISAGERDPDADDATGMSASKMRAIAVKGNYTEFKRGLPSTVRDIDGKRLMNDIRIGMGLEPIKEQLNLVKDTIREQYYNGAIFNIGDIVESDGTQYTIAKRGTNHLLLKEESGKLVSKWITDVTIVESAEMNEDLTDKTLKTNDKIKVARIIATMLGNEDAETSGSPDVLVNNAFRKAKTKALNPEAIAIISKMVALASEVGIKVDHNNLPSKLKEDAITSAQKQKMLADLSAKQAADKAKLFAAQKKEKEDAKKKGIDEDIPTVNKKPLMRPADFKRAIGAKVNDPSDEASDDGKETESDMDAMVGDDSTTASAVMGLMHPHAQFADIDHNLRRRKVKYHLGEGNGYDDNRTGFAKKKREDDEGHAKPKFKAKSLMDRPHTVHIDGKPWKKFDNGHQAHAAAKTLQAKGKKANAIAHFKEHIEEARMTAAMKLQKAFQREQEKVASERKAGEELLKKPVKEEAEVIDESMADSWKRVQSMDKGSVTGGKHEVKKRLAYLSAVHDHHKKFGNDTHKVKKEIESINRSKIAEDTSENPMDAYNDQNEIDVMTDADIDKIVAELSDDEIENEYCDDDMALVDSDTGEEVEELEDFNEEALMEVLSKLERMKAKARFARTKGNRERKIQIALKKHSSNDVINKRARRLAIKAMKRRLLRGRDINSMSVAEKERIERTLSKRKAVIGRVAMKLTARVRATEKARLSHGKYTKPSGGVSF
jgi:nicotinic acid mononucleotide adenylyltransferase